MTKSTKFNYIANGKTETNPFIVRDLDPAVYYSLGEKFDNFNFRKYDPSPELADEFLERRIKQLREKYSYIRLWFSGGKDCWLVLDTAIRFNVYIDEIVIIRKTCKNNLGLYEDVSQIKELDESAFAYLEKVKHLIPDTKITVIDSDDPHYEAVFENKDWTSWITEWYFSLTYMPSIFFKYINPKFNLLENIENSCSIVGSPVPAVRFNEKKNKWVFFFNDAKFSPVHGNLGPGETFEDFLITEDFPELAELHVNYIVKSLEKDQETEQKTVLALNETMRYIRDRSHLFHRAASEYTYLQNVKYIPKDFNFPDKSYYWKFLVNPTGLYDRMNRYHQDPQPLCWKQYAEYTDWAAIKRHIDRGGIINTKVWALEPDVPNT